MSETTTTPSNELRTLISEALHAYKLAQATRIQMERAAQQEHEQRLAAAESTRQATIQQLESERQQAEPQAVAEQERMGHLLAMIQEVEQGASDLLHKASLAHIAGAPLSVDGTAASVRRTDEQVAAAFTAVQLATADLQAGLLRLVQAFIDSSRWEEARRVLQPLLSDTQSTLYTDANNLLCESYYIPAMAALESQDWAEARLCFEAVLKVNTVYRDAVIMYHTSYFRPAELNPRLWQDVHDQVRTRLEGLSTDDPAKIIIQKECQKVLCEVHYQLGLQAIQAKDWKKVADHLRSIWESIPGKHLSFQVGPLLLIGYGVAWTTIPEYKETKIWPQKYPLSRWRIGCIKQVGVMNHPDEYLQTVSFSPNGRMLASASYSKLCLWNVESLEQIFYDKFPYAEKEYVLFKQITFQDDNTLIAQGETSDHKAYSVLFNIKTKLFSSPKPTSYGKREIYNRVKIPTEDLYISTSNIHDENGQCLFIFNERYQYFGDVAISPDGTLLAATKDRSILLWSAKI